MRINLKDAKGGATIYVLMTMLLLIIILISIYMSVTSKHIVQLDIAEQIKGIYEKDLANIDEVYENIISN